MKALIFSDFFCPSRQAGGSATALDYIVRRLDSRMSIEVITRSTEPDGTTLDVHADTWQPYGKALIRYCSRTSALLRLLPNAIHRKSPDLLFFNSLFSLSYTILPLIVARMLGYRGGIVLAPRGELFESALALGAQKKRIAIRLMRMLRLHRGVIWQVTSQFEEQEVKRKFPNAHVTRCNELLPPDVGVTRRRIAKDAGSLRLAFVSRLAKNKNLLYAIQLVDSIKDKNVTLDVFGPIDDPAYWEECQAAISRLDDPCRVRYKGIAERGKVVDLLSNYHAFLFPTLGENYGYVILEALLACRPVLISTETPWRDLREGGAGEAIDLARPDAFVTQILALRDMSQDVYDEACSRVEAYTKSYLLADESLTQRQIAVFSQAVTTAPKN